MAKKLRVAIIGFGPFGREVAKLLYGNVDELLILGKRGQHLEQFLEDERYAEKVLQLEGDIDTETVDNALVELGVLSGNGNASADGQGESKIGWSVEVAVVDMTSDSESRLNSHIVKKLSGSVGKVIVSAPSSADIDDLKKDGADLIVCAHAEAALRTVHNILNPKTEDIDRVSDNLYEASIALPEAFNGQTIAHIRESFGVHVIFIIRATPKIRRKKVVGYHNEEILNPDDPHVIAEEDTTIRVIGTLEQIRKLEDMVE